MGQIAYRADGGEMVEAFSVSDQEWQNICSFPRGALLMPRTDWPAIPKTSSRGLRFFAHHSGYPGIKPKPESYAHTRLKIDVVKAARELGYDADIEVYGTDPEGHEWVADVMVRLAQDARLAFEIQLSSQHLADFRGRTERYKRSGVQCCWIASEKPVLWRITKSLCNENIEHYKATGHFMGDCEDLLTLGMELRDKDEYPDELPLVRFSRGRDLVRLPLKEMIAGVLEGQPYWELPYWRWGDPASRWFSA